MRIVSVLTMTAFALLPLLQISGQTPDARTIIQESVKSNQRDFAAAPEYNHKSLVHTSKGSKLFEVTTIAGTPYRRLLAVNGEPLTGAQANDEMEKQKQAAAQRGAESPSQREQRVARYQKQRRRDQNMMNQLTEAFNFRLTGQTKMNGFDVYVLKATPKPGYKPPNMDCEVLPGMEGTLWIDRKAFQWVKITAEVIHPVSIEGFLAEVEPGTRFELEKAPVGNDVWLPSHFSMSSQAKVLFLVNHSSSEEDTFFDYEKINGSMRKAGGP